MIYSINDSTYIISLVSSIAAVCSAVATIISLIITIIFSRSTNDIQVRNMLNNCRSDFENLVNQKNKNKHTIKSKIENLYNIYDDACEKYKRFKLPRQSFKKRYKAEIINIYESNLLNLKDINCYYYLTKVYKKFKGRK